ncbi:hypothetical protein BGZ52_003968, partial [Haplosporangium bisporale]
MLRSLTRAARPAAIALARSSPVVRANVGAFSAIRNYATAKPGELPIPVAGGSNKDLAKAH